MPRIVFILNNPIQDFGMLEMSWADVIFRCISVFLFSYLILWLNTSLWSNKNILTKVFLSFGVFIVWRLIYRVVDHFIEFHTVISPRFDAFVYLLILIMLLVVSYTIHLNHQSKKDAIEKERLKQQGLQNELTALKNQMNPHFLFNSLNSLSLLVRKDQGSAEKFIQKLSFLYRYILHSADEDLVSLQEEMKFLKSYIYLMQQRYQENFEVLMEIPEDLGTIKIPSLALQLLVENAVKHNEISKRHPLKIEIRYDGNFLIVQNKIQLRTGYVESMEKGLSNLNLRYQLLKNTEIEIVNDAHNFIVKLPII
ncbi:DUF3972 domain-containing protein [bacterium SCSIO 12643]|nr:DUF3972 domain-containing protein [bacterium SCSIO 12643]